MENPVGVLGDTNISFLNTLAENGPCHVWALTVRI